MSIQEQAGSGVSPERQLALDEAAGAGVRLARKQPWRAASGFSAPWAPAEYRGEVVLDPVRPVRPPKRKPVRRPLGKPKRESCPKGLRELIIARDKGICQLCAEPVEEPSIDRIIPGSMGGKYDEDNCQLACRACNTRKGSELVPRFGYAWWIEGVSGG